jgi:DNA polymerase III epsilon subunit-like protein
MQLRSNKIVMYPRTGLVLVFDVETTGLLPKKNKDQKIEEISVSEYPYITQFSYVIFDRYTNTILKKVNNYIQIPHDIEIPEIVTRITGITKEICETKGISIINALIEFYRDIQVCDNIVAHNYAFDHKVIEIEFKRNYPFICNFCPNALILFTPEYLDSTKKQIFCTMKMSIYLCKIPFKTGGGYKFPKLSELHYHLFGYIPDNLHDAEVDVSTCLRCYNALIST